MRKDQRASRRRSLNYPAWIESGEGEPARCNLADISKTGARIMLMAGGTLPDEFVLRLTHAGPSKRRCRVVWRRGTTFGVRFVSENGPPEPVFPIA